LKSLCMDIPVMPVLIMLLVQCVRRADVSKLATRCMNIDPSLMEKSRKYDGRENKG